MIGKWGVDSGVSIVDRDGIRLPMLGVQDSYKYLGLQFGSEGFKWQPAQGVLEKGLREITTAPLNAGQRLYVLRNHLIPKLMHVLVLAMAPRQFLVNMDRLVRASVMSWVGITRHSALGLIHGGIASGGLSVPRLAKVVPLLQRDRLQSLARSAGGDEVLAAVIKTEYYGKLVARSLKAVKVGTAGVVVTSRQQVDAACFRWLKEDAPAGCFARGIAFNVKSGCWLSMAHFLGQISGAEVKQMN